MMPCCAAGAFFIFQLMVVYRWFNRAVLKKEVDDESEFWKPEKKGPLNKMKALFGDPQKRKVIISLFALQVAVISAVYFLGGFEMLGHAFKAAFLKPDTSLEEILDCCSDSSIIE